MKILSKTMDSTTLTPEKLELVTITHDSEKEQVSPPPLPSPEGRLPSSASASLLSSCP